jgi:hypothetical protein
MCTQVRRVLRQAWEMDDADTAEQFLRNLARRLEKAGSSSLPVAVVTTQEAGAHEGVLARLDHTSISYRLTTTYP